MGNNKQTCSLMFNRSNTFFSAQLPVGHQYRVWRINVTGPSNMSRQEHEFAQINPVVLTFLENCLKHNLGACQVP